MRRDWRVARVQQQEFGHSATGQPYVSVRFSLLESHKINNRKTRKVWSHFSSHPNALWKLKEFLDSIEAPNIVSLPNKVVQGRYCKLHLAEEEYEGLNYPRVRKFSPLNPRIKTPEELEAERVLTEDVEDEER